MLLKTEIEKVKKGCPYTIATTNITVQEMIETIEEMEKVIEFYATKIDDGYGWGDTAREFLVGYNK